ncbi:MAG TPA: hypothetical protein VFH38_03190 [Jatrophihabitans sp.]|nr:hypothetical protein [Jatrophihabitans sp.]
MAALERFEFGFDPRYRRAAWPFGVRPDTTWINVGGGTLAVRFGPWRVATPLTNIADVAITGPYAFVKTAGPARLGVTDRGLTFATNGRRGVCLQFREPIKGIDPWGLLRHPNLTLTAADCDALAAALRR